MLASRRLVLDRLLRRPVIPALIAVVLAYGLTAWLRCRPYAHDVSALIGFGCRTPATCWSERNRASLPASAVVFRSGGYDGQFFYYLTNELAGGPPAVLDSAPFRRARIGLSVLAAPIFAASESGRRYGLSLTLLGLHLASVACVFRARRSPLQGWLFALNPFSLLSFLLCTADGAALSLAVLGALAFERAVATAAATWSLASGVLLSFALLTKETALVVPLALTAAWFLDARQSSARRLRALVLGAAPLLPLVLWWRHVGFSFGLAASHGGLPFSGMLAYLPHLDLMRGLLVALVVFGAPLALSSLWRVEARVAGLALFGTIALVSTATAHEYWATISNVARLFTPMAAAPVLANADLRALAAGSSRPVRWLAVAWTAALVALCFAIVLREATRSPLPFYLQTRS